MAKNHVIQIGFGNAAPKSCPMTGDTEDNISVPVTSTNQAQGCAFAVAKLKSIYLLATGGNLTLKTNSTSAPDQTLTLKDGVPVAWNADMPSACPITADNTIFYLTKVTPANVVTFEADVLIDY